MLLHVLTEKLDEKLDMTLRDHGFIPKVLTLLSGVLSID